MSHAYSRRGSCAAGDVTDVGVGSSAWFGSLIILGLALFRRIARATASSVRLAPKRQSSQ